MAVLAVQLRQTLAEIAELAPLAQHSAVDETSARRAKGKPVAPTRAVVRGEKLHG